MDPELNAWTWLVRVFWALAVAALAALAIWTLKRAPGREQDPGLQPDDDAEASGDASSSDDQKPGSPWV